MKNFHPCLVIGKLIVLAILLFILKPPLIHAAPSCQNTALSFSDDYSKFIGSSDYYDSSETEQYQSSFAWIVNGSPIATDTVSELLLLHFDGNISGVAYDHPLSSNGVNYSSGLWGQALELQNNGKIEYPLYKNLDLEEGTIEMWIALRANGNDPIYSSQWHPLFYYSESGGDWLSVVQGENGVLYAGGMVNGQWESAYNGAVNTSTWPAGQWHHIAFTYSVSQNFMRFYLDGMLMADTNENHYWAPDSGSNIFVIGADKWGTNAHYYIDDVRILNHPASHSEITEWANRSEPLKAFETYLETSGLNPQDEIVFEFTPSNGSETGNSCISNPVIWPGIPLTNPNPVSTLLPPNTTDISFTVNSLQSTQCRYSIGNNLPYSQMTDFDTGAGTTFHETIIQGLNPDPNHVNNIYIRCADYPDFVIHLRYRCLPDINPSFPRTGNLWGSGGLLQKGLEYCSRIDLWLGAGFSADQIRQLRQMNPDILVLTSMNAVENSGLDESYYLKDIYGNKVETWPGSYRLNLTKLEVAEYQANYAYQKIINNDLMFDGCFFDNVMTTQSWQNKDIYGNPFLIDADEDGVEGDPQVFDAAWKAGVFHEIQTFRQLMPYALMTGHSMDIFEPGISDIFNATSIGFWTADVLEGERDFQWLWNRYQAWHTQAVAPFITMVESSPLDQIAYGYDFAPWNKIPASTLEFAKNYYPEVRFGLAFTLMQDGYFAHEFGDTWHGNDWWYDELDFDLGYPLGEPEFIEMGQSSAQNMLENPGFEDSLSGTWNFWANSGEGCVATLSRDSSDKAEGTYSARINISQTSQVNWHIELNQNNCVFTEGTRYKLTFWAKSDTERFIALSAQKQSPDWENFGLNESITLTTNWQHYNVSFTANADTTESRIQFLLGESLGTVWIDDVSLTESSPELMRRLFTNGMVLLNTSRDSITYEVGPDYRRLTGSQASRYEYIIDNSSSSFSTTGTWNEVTYDSGEWQASGPFYHNWGQTCHESNTAGSQAIWALNIPSADTYTITVWWANEPSAPTNWANDVLFQIVANEQVIASAVMNQQTGGDQWHQIATVALAPDDDAYVKLTTPNGGKTCIADALHVRSNSRFNDGSPANTVTLAPMDGIILNKVSLKSDLNSDGIVNLLDFIIFSQSWLVGY